MKNWTTEIFTNCTFAELGAKPPFSKNSKFHKVWTPRWIFPKFEPKHPLKSLFKNYLARVHSNLHLARVSVIAYAKQRLSFNVSECRQSGPYELLSTVRRTAAGKRITRCLFDEWKPVREMCPLADTHVER